MDNNKFSTPKGCLMIFKGFNTYGLRTRHMLTFFYVNGLYLTVPQYLKWFETAITFDRSGRFPLIVDPIVGNLRFFEVLMDGSSGLNIRYIEALVIMKVLCFEIKLGHFVEFSFR